VCCVYMIEIQKVPCVCVCVCLSVCSCVRERVCQGRKEGRKDSNFHGSLCIGAFHVYNYETSYASKYKKGNIQ
jgi:hypothetical protein